MADPVSVAGSAVGVISLAITTCQGLISYYNSWETQDQNVNDAKGKMERLRSSLSALEEIMPKISSSSAIAEHVERCVLSCGEGTARLDQFLERCRKDLAPLSLKDKLRVFKQKAIFPFRESSLDRLREIVRDLEGDLGTALQVLQLDTSKAQFTDLIDLTKSTAASVSEVNQNISNIEQKVNMVIGALPQIQTGVARFTSDVPMLRSSFTSMEQDMTRRLQTIEGLTSQILPDFQNKLDRLPLRIQGSLAESTTSTRLRPSVEISGLNLAKSDMSTTLTDMNEDARKLQLALAQRPSLLRTLCDEAGGLEMNVERNSTLTAQNKITQDRCKEKWIKQRLYCSCSTLIRERTATCSIGSVKVFQTSTESCKHSMSCPFYIGTEATTTIGLKTTYYGKLLAKTVRATISFTTGAGGLSISPCLKLRATVSASSTAFQILDPLDLNTRFRRARLCQTNEVGKYFEGPLQQLYELFQDNVASPTDVDEYGATLITVVQAPVSRRLHTDTCDQTLCKSIYLLEDFSMEVLQSFRIIFMGLVAAGVPLNEKVFYGHTALDTLKLASVVRLRGPRDGQEWAKLAMEVAEAGAEGSDQWRREIKLSPECRVRELEWMIKYEGWTDGYASAGYTSGALIAAIMRRSEDDTERILQTSPRSIYEQDLRGQSPLHLCCNWPRGIILLLHYGGREILDRSDNEGFLPLAYSCTSQCLEAVKLMLDADSALCSGRERRNWDNFPGVFEEAIMTSNDEIISHLETALVVRRIRLYTLATSELTPKELEELGVTSDRLLDEKACLVYAALGRKNVPIPSALRTPPDRTTLFHSEYLSPTLGESLYRRGFIDVEGVSASGLTPLMSLGYERSIRPNAALQRASWLISKGANLGRKPDQSEYVHYDPSITAAHCICSWIGIAMYLQDFSKHEWQRLRRLPSEVNHTREFRTLDELDEDCRSVLGKLVFSKYYDHCLCACLSHGCTPAIVMLKNITRYNFFSNDSISPTEWRLLMIDWVKSLLGHPHKAWQWLSREIIRYVTFEELGLTHTCCKSRHKIYDMDDDMDNTEREEIQDEQRFLISKLDALVTEFEEKYIELGVTVPEFMNGYWKTRMEEVEKEDEPLDDEQIAKIKDLGVVIHS